MQPINEKISCGRIPALERQDMGKLREPLEDMDCGLPLALEVMGERWSFMILRAAFNNARGGDTQGASTITQQYVKVFYLSQERTWSRKLKEAILSLKIQRQESKQEILQGTHVNTDTPLRIPLDVVAAAAAAVRRAVSNRNADHRPAVPSRATRVLSGNPRFSAP